MGGGRRSAFTVVELTAVIVAASVGGAFLTVIGGGQPEKGPEQGAPAGDKTTLDALVAARARAREIKDATHVRAMVQGMQLWAQTNQDRFPLPSLVDMADATVKEPAPAKNVTANIYSLLVFNGMIPVDLLVSSAEASADIGIDEDYQFENPRAAVKPEQALWDPGFRADFRGGKKGNTSFAHVSPSDERKARWMSTFISTEPVCGNRGPRIESITTDAAGIRTAKVADANTLTFLIHGKRDRWEGNIGYNDGHVSMETTLLAPDTTPAVEWPRWTDKEGKSWADCMFYDEPGDAAHANAFMGIFTKSGGPAKDWEAIWD